MISQGLALLAGLVEYAQREVNVPMGPEQIVGGIRMNFGDGSRIDLDAEEVARIADEAGYTRTV